MTDDPELKGEHFDKNNPDMMLDFEKPDKAEIDEMNYKKPITTYKDLPQRSLQFNASDGSGDIEDGFTDVHTIEWLDRVKDLPNDSSSIKRGEEG